MNMNKENINDKIKINISNEKQYLGLFLLLGTIINGLIYIILIIPFLRGLASLSKKLNDISIFTNAIIGRLLIPILASIFLLSIPLSISIEYIPFSIIALTVIFFTTLLIFGITGIINFTKKYLDNIKDHSNEEIFNVFISNYAYIIIALISLFGGSVSIYILFLKIFSIFYYNYSLEIHSTIEGLGFRLSTDKIIILFCGLLLLILLSMLIPIGYLIKKYLDKLPNYFKEVESINSNLKNNLREMYNSFLPFSFFSSFILATILIQIIIVYTHNIIIAYYNFSWWSSNILYIILLAIILVGIGYLVKKYLDKLSNYLGKEIIEYNKRSFLYGSFILVGIPILSTSSTELNTALFLVIFILTTISMGYYINKYTTKLAYYTNHGIFKTAGLVCLYTSFTGIGFFIGSIIESIGYFTMNEYIEKKLH
jgi:uncharacterized membrane protein